MSALASLLLAVSEFGTAQAQHSAATPISNVQVSHDTFLAHSEPHVVEDPANPKILVAASKFFTDPAHYQFKIGTYSSSDGGRTWQDHGLLPGFSSFALVSDVSLAFSPNGSIVYAVVLATRGVGSGIYVSRSKDGGTTWSPPTTVLEDPSGATFSDKPWIGVDWTHRTSRGTVYVAWNLDDNTGSSGDPDAGHAHLRAKQTSGSLPIGIVVSRSTDYGITFSKPVVVRAFTPTNGHFAIGATPAVGPNGHVFIAYLTDEDVTMGGHTTSTHRVDVAESSDHGAHFTIHTAASGIRELPNQLPNGTFRNVSLPAFAVSQHDGSMVVTWADMRNGDADILAARSTDRARTWSSPVRVNDDALHNRKDQFQPAIAVAPNGVYSLSWFDRRYDPNNRLIDVAIAQSHDDGTTFSASLRVTSTSWDPSIDAPVPGRGVTFIGDYQGLAVDNKQAHPLWNDTQNSTSQEIRTAIVGGGLFKRRAKGR